MEEEKKYFRIVKKKHFLNLDKFLYNFSRKLGKIIFEVKNIEKKFHATIKSIKNFSRTDT
jgi:hypothetical protein